MKQSLIYRNIYLYRIMMNLIYFGKYKRRFRRINKLIIGTTVVELCLGDTYIADYCKKKGIHWTGYDLNENFVAHARKLKFNAFKQDIVKLDDFQNCDSCIMVGSLYHFKDIAIEMLNKMIKSAKQVIISEPIKNISTSDGIFGYIARRSANAGKGHEVFRFNESTFIEMIDKLNVNYKVIWFFIKVSG